jgi:hypothetical protein
MEHRAWKSVRFEYPRDVPTMLRPEETKYLYWLGRDVWKGNGLVVEIGPWLGGSTVCLASGMRASGHDANSRLHAVDNFRWREFMAARASLPLQPGESFQPAFLNNVSAFTDIVRSHARTLPDEVIEGDHEATAKRASERPEVPVLDAAPGEGPIEILFIDGAKSWRGMKQLLSLVRGRVIPGRTLIVCQDFKYWGTYWVAMMMARLGDLVVPAHNVLGATTVAFRLVREIPRELVDGLEDHVARIPTQTGLALINAARKLLIRDGDWPGAANLSLCRVSFLAHQGKTGAAAVAFKQSQWTWPAFMDANQLERARNYLKEEKGTAIYRPIRFPIEKKLLGAVRALTRAGL